MPSGSREPHSILKTVKRDWSEPSQRIEPDVIPWAVTQPAPAKETLSGVERRLRDIKEALAGGPVASERALSNTSTMAKKRSITSSSTETPPAKRRQSLTLDPPVKPPSKSEILHSSTNW